MLVYGGPPPGQQERLADARNRTDHLGELADHQRQVREAKEAPGRARRRSVVARLWSMITGRAARS